MDDEVMSLKQQVQALTAKLAKDSETKKKLRTHVVSQHLQRQLLIAFIFNIQPHAVLLPCNLDVTEEPYQAAPMAAILQWLQHLLKEKAINLGILVTELQSVKQDKAGLQQECERLTAALAGEQQRVQEAVQREQLTAQQKLQKEQQFFDLAREKQQLQSSWATHERELQQLQKQLHAAVQVCCDRELLQTATTLSNATAVSTGMLSHFRPISPILQVTSPV
jgi:predicted  nucleic acid-binding Zn-ribbon protein